MSILKITSTGVECPPHLPELGWRLRRSAFTRLKSSSSSSSSSRWASSGSNWRLSLGTNSKRFTESYLLTIMVVGSGPVGILSIGILQNRPNSQRKLVLGPGSAGTPTRETDILRPQPHSFTNAGSTFGPRLLYFEDQPGFRLTFLDLLKSLIGAAELPLLVDHPGL